MTAALQRKNVLYKLQCWSPGLVVLGGDSCPEGRGFESQHQILDGSHIFVVKIIIFV